MLPYPKPPNILGMNQVNGGKDFFEKLLFPKPEKVKGGCAMTLLEILALLTFVFTLIYETVDITLKIMQYIEDKQNKRD